MLLRIAPYLVVFACFVVNVKVLLKFVFSHQLKLISYNRTWILRLVLRYGRERRMIVTFLLSIVFHFTEDACAIGIAFFTLNTTWVPLTEVWALTNMAISLENRDRRMFRFNGRTAVIIECLLKYYFSLFFMIFLYLSRLCICKLGHFIDQPHRLFFTLLIKIMF